MIAIIAPDPSFGAAYNIRTALHGALICDRKDGWREWEPDILLDSEHGIWQARSVIQQAEHVLIISTWGLKTWAKIDTEHERLAMLVVESRMERYPDECRTVIREAGIKQLFHLPNLSPYMPDRSVAMLQPVVVPETAPVKATDGPTIIVHTPGTEKKRHQKGSGQVQRVIDEMSVKHDIEYREIIMASHAETLAHRAAAHICIDQIPPAGWPRGLGLSGEESLAYGCATVSTMYPQTYAGTYPYPPVHVADSGYGLKKRLNRLLVRPREWLIEQGRFNHAWAANHLSPEFWGAFYWTYMPAEWAVA